MRDLGNILPRARGVVEKQPHARGGKASEFQVGDEGANGAKLKAKSLLKATLGPSTTEEDVDRWVDEVHKMLKWFSDRHHFSHELRSGPSEAELSQHVEAFERLLLKFTHTFFGLLDHVRRIVSEVDARGGMPSDQEIRQVWATVEWLPELAWPFFSLPTGPGWLVGLRGIGAFDEPPVVIRSDDGTVRYVAWAASRYLARMAKHVPGEVAVIFAGIETDNPSVVGDMLTATFDMPVDVAETLVPAVCRAAYAGLLWVHFGDAAKLCRRLAEGGQVPSAMTLARALFTPRFEEGREQPSWPDIHQYRAGLTLVVPALAARQGRESASNLCDWLRAAIEARKHVDIKSKSDYSYVWRPGIEEHDQNEDYDFASAMVGFTRAGFEEAVCQGQMTLDEALQILDRQEYTVFKRMRFHLINRFAEQNRDLARQTMMNRGLFDDYQYRHEYAMLVGRRLSMLDPKERTEWLGWIEAGPDMSNFDNDVKQNLGRDPTEDDRRARIQHWQFKRLHWIRDHLDGHWQEFYHQMRTEHGEPEMADMNIYMGPVTMGAGSPMSVEELKDECFTEVVDRVAAWRPDKPRFIGPDIEGLAATFGEYVATDPGDFSKQSRILIGRPAVYVREFISKMTDAVKAGEDTDVAAVLELCRWVLERPVAERTTPEQDDDVAVDKDWQWTRDQVSEFVQTVCQSSVDGKPRYPLEGLRETMWAVLAPLTHDPVKSYMVRELETEDPRVHDYLDMGINSPRGKAVRAGLEYARWVANHTKQAEVVPGGFGGILEVRQMLEWQIAPENRSVEVMSIVGSSVGLIHWIDKAWLQKHADAIMDLGAVNDDPQTASGWSAWNAFVVWDRPHIEFYRLLKNQFACAVRQASRVELPESSAVRPQPMHRLGEHLMILYGRGQLGLNEDDGLLRRFLSESIPDIRRHAVGFVGESLQGDQRIPDGVAERFMTLWDWYWSNCGREDAKQNPNDQLFGPWFTCGRFPDQWSIERLEQFVQVAPVPQPAHEVMERLAAILEVDIARVTAIVDTMVRGDKEGWRVHDWRESARKILRSALDAGGDVRQKAMHLIDYLGRRGYTDFGTLL